MCRLAGRIWSRAQLWSVETGIGLLGGLSAAGQMGSGIVARSVPPRRWFVAVVVLRA